jgi:hypothetical protein
LYSACSWGQTAGERPTLESSRLSTEQNQSATTAGSGQQSTQHVTAPEAIPRTDQNGNNQTPTNGTSTNATEDSDLARIPTGPKTATANDGNAKSAGDANQRIYLENAYTQSDQRSGLIVLSPKSPATAAWQERLFLDFRKVWRLDS